MQKERKGQAIRLIDADKMNLLLGISDRDIYAKRMLDHMDTVDAVPVTRCKDCKYYKPDEYECGCDFAGGLPYVKADDFCRYGERRDDA